MKKIIETLFWITLGAFLALGLTVVVGQLVGVVAVSPGWVSGASKLFSDTAFTLSTLCAVFAFALQYFKTSDADEAGDAEQG